MILRWRTNEGTLQQELRQQNCWANLMENKLLSVKKYKHAMHARVCCRDTFGINII